MKAMIKQLAKRLIGSFVSITSKTSAGRHFNNQLVNTAMSQILKISHGSLDLTLPVPNQLCYWRAKTFSTKEPETLEWIDGLPEGALLWDVGANVGLYSVYAAKQRNCRVWAFEPSVFNLEFLARNLFLNGVTERVCLVPLALSNGLGSRQLHMTTTEWGGALSTFGQDYGWDGKTLRQVFGFQTLGLSMDDAVQRLGLPQPDYIKMDVDGIEHLILQGGSTVLGQIKGVHIEVTDDFHEQAEQCQRLLSEAGLILKEKRHSEMFNNSPYGYQNTFNQSWVRP